MTEQSLLEPLFQDESAKWIFSTPTPSLADIALYYQLNWGMDMASGRGIEDLTGGGTKDTDTEGALGIFSKDRYPGLHKWFHEFRSFVNSLPSMETVATSPEATSRALEELRNSQETDDGEMLLPTLNASHQEFDEKNGLILGTRVSVVPEDTGRDKYVFQQLAD
jgi:hypothetical protein